MKSVDAYRLAVACLLGLSGLNASADEAVLIEPLRASARRAITGAGQIEGPRRRVLERAAEFIRQRLDAGQPAQLTFVCTHNSRRSHMAQVWAQTAAAYYGVANVQAASGGTEATACNIRTIRALRRAGFSITDSTGGKNPVYLAQASESLPPTRLFSKVYDHADNPRTGFAVLMCCDQADAACPVVPGAAARFPIHYVDPKLSDDTEAEAATYDERNRQIAREMFYMMSRVRGKI